MILNCKSRDQNWGPRRNLKLDIEIRLEMFKNLLLINRCPRNINIYTNASINSEDTNL